MPFVRHCGCISVIATLSGICVAFVTTLAYTHYYFLMYDTNNETTDDQGNVVSNQQWMSIAVHRLHQYYRNRSSRTNFRQEMVDLAVALLAAYFVIAIVSVLLYMLYWCISCSRASSTGHGPRRRRSAD